MPMMSVLGLGSGICHVCCFYIYRGLHLIAGQLSEFLAIYLYVRERVKEIEREE